MKTDTLISPLDRRRFFSITEVAQLLGFSPTYLRDQIHRGTVKATQINKWSKWWIAREELERIYTQFKK